MPDKSGTAKGEEVELRNVRAQTHAAATDAQKCAAAKIKAAGKYEACRQNADSKAEATNSTAEGRQRGNS